MRYYIIHYFTRMVNQNIFLSYTILIRVFSVVSTAVNYVKECQCVPTL